MEQDARLLAARLAVGAEQRLEAQAELRHAGIGMAHRPGRAHRGAAAAAGAKMRLDADQVALRADRPRGADIEALIAAWPAGAAVRANRRLVHQIPAGPESAAQRQALLDDERTEPHSREVAAANQPGGTGPHDDHIAFDELVELLIVFPGDVPGDIAFAQRRWFGLGHGVLLNEC